MILGKLGGTDRSKPFHIFSPCFLSLRLAMLGMSLLCRGTFYSFVGRHREAITDFTEQVNIAESIHGRDSIEVSQYIHMPLYFLKLLQLSSTM